MRRGRIITGTIIVMAAAMLSVSSAFAATPSEIAKDLADGKLDGTYSQQELANYLKNATLQGYPPAPQPPGGEAPANPPASGGVAGAQSPPPAGSQGPAGGVQGEQSPLGETQQVGSLPFTGVDLMLLAAGGAALLLIGLGARRVGRQRS